MVQTRDYSGKEFGYICLDKPLFLQEFLSLINSICSDDSIENTFFISLIEVFDGTTVEEWEGYHDSL